jgi:hypothetical protein
MHFIEFSPLPLFQVHGPHDRFAAPEQRAANLNDCHAALRLLVVQLAKVTGSEITKMLNRHGKVDVRRGDSECLCDRRTMDSKLKAVRLAAT